MKSAAVLSGAGSNDTRFLDRNPLDTALRTSRNDFWQRARALFDRVLRLSSRAPRRLRLCESLPLGERRFVAVIEFESARFLVGGTSASLVLLARLQDAGREVDLSEKDLAEPSAGALR
jgi:Flagellar biosynthesis protein, FliO